MSAALDLEHLPDTYELPKATWRLGLMLGVSAAFFLIGVTLALAGKPAEAWPAFLIIPGLLVVFLLVLFSRSAVTLDRDGFTYSWLFGGRHYAWRDVSEFTARQMGRSRLIAFNDQTKVDGALSGLSRFARGGYNSSINAIFIGGKLEAACATMNAFRARALRRAA